MTALLTSAVGASTVCPERFNNLPHWPAGSLARFRLFAGHFDRINIDVIPGARKILTMLRNPRDRLISTYRFWRIQPRDVALRLNQPYVLAAKDLDFASFLRKMPEISIQDVDNMYARVFGGFISMRGDPPDVRRWPLEKFGGGARAVDQAIRFLDSCAAIGILEEFDRSVSLIFDALNLPPPSGKIAVLMNTNDLAQNSTKHDPIENFEITKEAEHEIEQLTRYDKEIYRYGLSLYQSRANRGIEPKIRSS